MAVSHHGDGSESEFIKKLREAGVMNTGDPRQRELLERYKKQVNGEAERSYSNGRKGANDDGDLAFVIASDRDEQIVKIDFGKPVAFIGMPPQQAVELAQMLIRHARSIATEPIRIVMN